jgi:hypothetical protein
MPFAQHGLNWRSLSKINQAKKASTGWSHSCVESSHRSCDNNGGHQKLGRAEEKSAGEGLIRRH